MKLVTLLLVSLPLCAPAQTTGRLHGRIGTDPIRTPIKPDQSEAPTSFLCPATDNPQQLSATEVTTLVYAAAEQSDNPAEVIAIVDRPGNPLAIYRRPQAIDSDVDTALSLARTGAFFSNFNTPLSSRTVRAISRPNFPENVPNTPSGALYGIENTNRGCFLNTTFLPGQAIPPSRNASNTNTGYGIATTFGGLPIFRNGTAVIGGIGIAGFSDQDAAEFAAFLALKMQGFLPNVPLPPPGAVFLDGFALPFITLTPPALQSVPQATIMDGRFQIAPKAGKPIPDGWLVGPMAGSQLSKSDVTGIIQNAVNTANLTRAAIRLPIQNAEMMIAVVDLDGTILGLYRMMDATIFSIDVSVAKARNVVYFSDPNLTPQALSEDLPGVPVGTAVTNRTIGFGAQPFFPSGINANPPGPFFPLFLFDLAHPCTQGHQPKNANQSGIVFFPGSAPLYRNNVMVGGLGVSGDGVEQDDFVTSGGTLGFEAPLNIRADQIIINKVRLPYLKFDRDPETGFTPASCPAH